jgi:proteasome lid subunit RPN8/RPN11
MLILVPEFRAKMISHARSGFPNEACGLLAGEQLGEKKIVRRIYCLKNIDQSPEHFSMMPEDQFRVIAEIRKKGWTLLGNFHSHPATPARPSEEDIRLAFDPSLSYIIISLENSEPIVKSFRIRQGIIEDEPLGP